LTQRITRILTLTALVAGCAPTPKRVIPVPVAIALPEPVLPPYSTTADVFPAEIPSDLPPRPPILVDAVGLAIAEARLHFDRGFGLYDTGFLKQARS
jgi:hypothetical protein